MSRIEFEMELMRRLDAFRDLILSFRGTEQDVNEAEMDFSEWFEMFYEQL